MKSKLTKYVYSICLDSYSSELGEVDYGNGPFFDQTKLVDSKQLPKEYSTYEECDKVENKIIRMLPNDIINLSNQVNLTINDSTRYLVISLKKVGLNKKSLPWLYRVIDLSDNKITDEGIWPESDIFNNSFDSDYGL